MPFLPHRVLSRPAIVHQYPTALAGVSSRSRDFHSRIIFGALMSSAHHSQPFLPFPSTFLTSTALPDTPSCSASNLSASLFFNSNSFNSCFNPSTSSIHSSELARAHQEHHDSTLLCPKGRAPMKIYKSRTHHPSPSSPPSSPVSSNSNMQVDT